MSRLQALIFLRKFTYLGSEVNFICPWDGGWCFFIGGDGGGGGCYKYGRFVNVHVLFDHSSHLGNLLRSFFFYGNLL